MGTDDCVNGTGSPEMSTGDPDIEKAFALFDAGKSFLLSGPAGTGKSTLIQEFRKRNKKIAVTALTGIAAVLIKGRTLHSFLGVKPDDLVLDNSELVSKLKKKKWLVSKLKKLDVLIIDEVSMLDKEFFETLEFVLRHLQGSMTAFGGTQIVLIGDFYQLPPVKKKGFLFDSPLLYKVFDRVLLTTIFRQSDPVFQSLLLRMRCAELRDADCVLLQGCLQKDVSVDGILPTKLYSTNVDVDQFNRTELQKLESTSVTFTSEAEAHPFPEYKESDVEKALDAFRKDYCIGPLALKVGAQVLLTVNLDLTLGLCNGSRGVIVRFEPLGPIVRFLNPDRKPVEILVPPMTWTRKDYEAKVECVSYNYLPLKLAWAITVHKSQGLSLDCAELSLDSSIFEFGQAYVAVSRVRSFAGLSLRAFQKDSIKAHPDVTRFYRTPYSVLCHTHS